MSDALEAARRLAAKLPSRTHTIDAAPPLNTARAVVIAGVTYASLNKAARAHHVSIGAVQKWLDRGKAVPA